MGLNEGGAGDSAYRAGSEENFPGGGSWMPEEGGPRVPAWEYPEGMGMGRALLLTLRSVLFNPVETFRHMRPTGNLTRAYLFALIVNVVVGFITLLVGLMLQAPMHAMLDWVYVHTGRGHYPAAGLSAFLVFLVFMVRIAWMFLRPVVTAGILHGFLVLTGGGARSFDTTFRVTCYSQSASVWYLVPCLGGIVGFLWYVVCLALGLMEQQRISSARAVAVILLSYLVFCCCLCSFVPFLR